MGVAFRDVLSLDVPRDRQERFGMATRKSATVTKEVVSKGTVLAAKYRARANALSDAERQSLRGHAMSLIYGNPHAPVLHARRG